MYMPRLTLPHLGIVVALLLFATLLFSGLVAAPTSTDLAVLGAIGATKFTHCRVLVDFTLEGIHYKCDQVLKLPADSAKSLQEAGMLDAARAAVDYALSENGGQTLTHETEAERAANAARVTAAAVVADLQAKVDAEKDAATLDALRKELDAATAALAALG